MAKALQPQVGFNIVFNERIFFKRKIFTIDSMVAKQWPAISQVLGI